MGSGETRRKSVNKILGRGVRNQEHGQLEVELTEPGPTPQSSSSVKIVMGRSLRHGPVFTQTEYSSLCWKVRLFQFSWVQIGDGVLSFVSVFLLVLV